MSDDAQVIRFPLFVQPSTRDSNSLGTKDARLFNAYLEKERSGEVSLYKRPGVQSFIVPGASASGLGMYNWNGLVYSVVGTTFYANTTNLGTVDGVNGLYRFQPINGASVTTLFLSNGTNSYTYTVSGGLVHITNIAPFNFTGTTAMGSATVTSVSSTTDIRAGDAISDNNSGSYILAGTTVLSVDSATQITLSTKALSNGSGITITDTPLSVFPSNLLKGVSFLDGTVYVVDANGSVWGSNINGPSIWNPLNVIVAQISSDQTISIGKQLNNVVVFKQWSTEFFYDAANATGSPLGANSAAKIPFGCLNADTIQSIDETLFWLSSTRSGAAQVIMLSSLTPTIVSTTAIEKYFNSASTSNLYSFSFKYNGHAFYGITSTDLNVTFVYDAKEHLWAQWSDINGNYFPYFSTIDCSANGASLLQSFSTGIIYKPLSTVFQDDGVNILVDVYTELMDGGSNYKKFLQSLELIGDFTPGSVVAIRHSDDDYNTFSNFRYIDMGSPRARLVNCGSFRRRAYHLRHLSNTPLRLQALEVSIIKGSL